METTTITLKKYELYRLILFTRGARERYKENGANTLVRMADETLRKLEDTFHEMNNAKKGEA